MSGLTWVRRSVAVFAVTLTVLAVPASPAAAHGRGSDATNLRAQVTDAPAIDGVTWRVYGGDEFLSVTNTTDRDLFILAYASGDKLGEPFLRVGPDGVFENRASPYTYSVRDRYGAVSIPATADPEAEPQWVRISGGQTALWHDHRIHWMAPTIPPAVVDPSVETVVIPDWEVPFRLGDEVHTVTGELRWVPGTSPWPWLLAGLVLTLPALAGLRTKPVPSGDGGLRWPGLVRPAALVLGVLATLNVTHLVDDLIAVPLPLSTRLIAASQTLLFIVIAGFAARRAWQAGDGAFTALGVGAGALLMGQGLLYLPTLSVSQTASVLPTVYTRLVVGLSIAQVLPLGIVTVVGSRRVAPALEPEPEPQSATAGG